MADSITLNNTDLFKGLVPVNPHALVPVESLTNSPTSSTGSASVLEWNSNSDSELFQLSSPPSAPALTAQPTSPMFSSYSPTPPSVVGSASTGGPPVDDQYNMHWPELRYEEDSEVQPAPVADASTAPTTVSDDIPALNEHPEELNALIERLFFSDLNKTVNKWKSTSNAASTEVAPDPSSATPLTAEDTSMTSTVLGGSAPYINEEEEQPSTSMTTVTPPNAAPTDVIPAFEGSSPQAAAASLISIAEYFRRKALEGAPPAPDNAHLIATAAAVSVQPASPGSVLSYFSPPASSPHLSTAPSSGSPVASFHFWDRSVQTDNALRSAAPVATESVATESVVGDECASASSSTSVRSAAGERPVNDLFAPCSPSTEVIDGPMSVPSVVGNWQASFRSPSKPQVNTSSFPLHATTSGPHRYGNYTSVPTWLPRPPELEFREALLNAQSATPQATTASLEASSIKPALDRPGIHTWLSQQVPPQPLPAAPSVLLNTISMPRKPRPPLPAVPRAKAQPAPTPTPQFALQGELPPPVDAMRSPVAHFAQALPSTWTGRRSPRPLGPPSLVPSSPALTAQPSDYSGWASAPRAKYTAGHLYGMYPPQPASWAGRPAAPDSQDGSWLPFAYPSSDAMSASDDVPPIPPPARGAYTPTPPPHPPHHTPAMGAGEPTWCQPFMPDVLMASAGGCDWGAFSPPQGRRLRFATPPSSARWGYYAPPPGPPPTLNSFVPPPSPPVMCGAPLNYMYSSPAPVIPPLSSASASENCGWYTTDRKYSFEDATVIFRVETYLFRVHRHFFERHSEYFRKLLATYWFNEASHIFLPDVKKTEFEDLLSLFYPNDLTKCDITTLKGWTAVLALAQKWDMAQVRALAVRHIGAHPSPMDKLIIAHKHGLRNPSPAWLLPAYKAVCARAAPLAVHEAEQLDVATVVRIWEVQHEVRAAQLMHGCRAEDVKIEQLVRAKFGAFEDEEGTPHRWRGE